MLRGCVRDLGTYAHTLRQIVSAQGKGYFDMTKSRKGTMTKSKSAGRPTIPTDAKRRNRVTFCLTDAELDGLRAEAQKHRVALSVWLRLQLQQTGTTADV